VESTRGLPPRPRLTTEEIPAMPMGHIFGGPLFGCCVLFAASASARSLAATDAQASGQGAVAADRSSASAQGNAAGTSPQTTPAGIRRAGRRGMAFSSPGTPRAANPVIPSLRARLKPPGPVATIPKGSALTPTSTRFHSPTSEPGGGCRGGEHRKQCREGRRHDASRLTSKPKTWIPRRGSDAQ